MLYLNPDRTLHDCSDIENGELQDSEVIQDYKKLSKKASAPGSTKQKSSKPPSQAPAKPRQFLFTKSDSNSSLSSLSDEEDSDWKVIVTTVNGGEPALQQTFWLYVGLFTKLFSFLFVVIIKFFLYRNLFL